MTRRVVYKIRPTIGYCLQFFANHLQKLVLTNDFNGGDLFGLLQFRTGVLTHYQVIELGAYSGDDLTTVLFHQLLGLAAFQLNQTARKQNR